MPYPIWSPLRLIPLWNAVREADLVYLHDYIYVGSLAAFSMAKILRKPILITQHVGAVPFRSRLMSRMLTVANLTLGRTMLKYADAAAFVSNTVRTLFLPDGSAGCRGRLIPNGLDLPRSPRSPTRRVRSCAPGWTFPPAAHACSSSAASSRKGPGSAGETDGAAAGCHLDLRRQR